MSQGFNLVDSPWIPCVGSQGEVELQGLLGTLTGAGRFAELRADSPLVTVAIYRLLLAVLHRVFGPATPDAWETLWKGGRFDSAKLEEYLKSSPIYPRFDLFDDKHPFYQTASLPIGAHRTKKTKKQEGYWYSYVQPVWHMAHELGSSDNMHLFCHVPINPGESHPAAEAARWLVAFQAFALGGTITTEEGKKQQDGSADAGQLVKSAVVLAKGDSLFETLLLNLVHYTQEEEKPFAFTAGADKLAWERDEETKPTDRKYDGYLDLLTWQSRRVKLIPDRGAEGQLLGVSGMVAMKGFQLPDGYWRHQRETMVGFGKAKYPKPKDDPWPPLGFRAHRDLWRDSHTLFQSVAEETQRPGVLSWVDDLRQEGRLVQKQIQINVYGMSSNQAKVFFWRHESLPVPLQYLRDKKLAESLKEILQVAEEFDEALSAAVRRAVATALKPGKDEQKLAKKEREVVDRAAQSLGAQSLFWSRLETPFRRLMVELPGDDDHRKEQLRRWFAETLRPAVRDAYRRTAGELESSSRALRAAVAGEQHLERRLGRIAVKCGFVADTTQLETDNARIG